LDAFLRFGIVTKRKQMITNVTDTNFDALVLNNEMLVVVDFWANWCKPCLELGKTLEELAPTFEGKAMIAKLNVAHNPVISTRYMVLGLPTILIFKNGEIVNKITGKCSKNVIEKAIIQQL
jgi:thioredoxin 1